MEPVKVVARYVNGRILKGFTQDFFPNRDRFHLFPAERPSSKALEIAVNDLKAVFVVRDFIGDAKYVERKRYLDGEKPAGKKVTVTFSDGEVIVGSTLGYDLNRLGFFIFPADPKSNNIRVFAVCAAIQNARPIV
jgi:hypothetical protein